METNRPFNNNNRVIMGVMLVAGGFLLLAYKLGAPIPKWIFSWEVLLIFLGILSGIKHRFHNAGWIIMISIGSIFLIDEQMPQLDLHEYIVPIIVIGVGALFILRPKHSWEFSRKRREWRNNNRFGSWGSNAQDSAAQEAADEGSITDADYLKINSVFSGVKRTILSKNFKGGTVSCMFGGAEIDLTQADINGRVVLRIEQAFGGTKLMIPPHWNVQNEIDGAFHGVDDKRNYNAASMPDPSKVLVLKGSCMFAGVDIRSY